MKLKHWKENGELTTIEEKFFIEEALPITWLQELSKRKNNNN